MAHVPVVLIHGFPFDHLLWRHQVAALSGWRCIAPDLRGAGAFGVPKAVDEFSMRSYAEDLVALLDRLEVDQAVVCGLSLGGYIAFELLRRFPERVRAAILDGELAPGAVMSYSQPERTSEVHSGQPSAR